MNLSISEKNNSQPKNVFAAKTYVHKFFMYMCRISDDVDRQSNNNRCKIGEEGKSSIGIERKATSKREQISMKR